MRIVSGTHKGRRIMAPKSLPVRPTTDLAKESLFNILNNKIDFDDCDVLDLFGGTGNISYEFASRGVDNIITVDSHYGCVQFIKKTSDQLNLPITAVKADVYKFLTKTALTFDVIFADPPYDFSKEKFLEIIDLVMKGKLLNKNGLLIIEHSKYTDLSTHANFVESRRYGASEFSFFE